MFDRILTVVAEAAKKGVDIPASYSVGSVSSFKGYTYCGEPINRRNNIVLWSENRPTPFISYGVFTGSQSKPKGFLYFLDTK